MLRDLLKDHELRLRIALAALDDASLVGEVRSGGELRRKAQDEHELEPTEAASPRGKGQLPAQFTAMLIPKQPGMTHVAAKKRSLLGGFMTRKEV